MDKLLFIHFKERREYFMNIIIHYPKSVENIDELKKRVSKVHAEAIASYISTLNYPLFQKLILLEKLKK